MIKDLEPDIANRKKIELIELDIDEDSNDSCIVLDDSVIEVGSTQLDNNVGVYDVAKNSSQYISGNRITQKIEDRAQDQSRKESETDLKTNCQGGVKRKRDNEEEVIEIMDDDVVILDYSYTLEDKFAKRKRIGNECSTVVDLTESFSAEGNISSYIKKKCLNKKHPKTIVNDSNRSIELSSDRKLLIHVENCVTECSTSTSSVSPTSFTKSNEIPIQPSLSKTVSPTQTTNVKSIAAGTSVNQSKKANKLSYQTPAHLSASLIKSSKNSNTANNNSNIYNPSAGVIVKSGLRPVIIDGNNVAVG